MALKPQTPDCLALPCTPGKGVHGVWHTDANQEMFLSNEQLNKGAMLAGKRLFANFRLSIISDGKNKPEAKFLIHQKSLGRKAVIAIPKSITLQAY